MNLLVKAWEEDVQGKECWSVIAGAGTGSVVSIGFGQRVPAAFSSNYALSLEERQFQAEYEIFIECSWRLEDEQSVLATWAEATEGDSWLEALDRLRGRYMEALGCSLPAGDLRLSFTGGLRLLVFCDGAPGEDCYTLFSPQRTLVVRAGGIVAVEEPS